MDGLADDFEQERMEVEPSPFQKELDVKPYSIQRRQEQAAPASKIELPVLELTDLSGALEKSSVDEDLNVKKTVAAPEVAGKTIATPAIKTEPQGKVTDSAVEKTASKIADTTDTCAGKVVADGTAKPATKPESKVVDSPVAKPEGKVVDAPFSKPQGKVTDIPVAKPEAKSADLPGAKPEGKAQDTPATKPESKVAEAPTAKPGVDGRTVRIDPQTGVRTEIEYPQGHTNDGRIERTFSREGTPLSLTHFDLGGRRTSEDRYTADGRSLQTTTYYSADGSRPTTVNRYGDNNRPVSSTSYAENGSIMAVTTYDTAGRRAAERQFTNSRVVSDVQYNPNGQERSRTSFDARERPVTIITPESTTRFHYSEQPNGPTYREVTYRGERGADAPTTEWIDQNDRVVRARYSNGTEYIVTYDAEGRRGYRRDDAGDQGIPRTTTDSRTGSYVIRYGADADHFDAQGRLRQRERNGESHWYDGDGTVVRNRDRQGNEFVHRRNPQGGVDVIPDTPIGRSEWGFWSGQSFENDGVPTARGRELRQLSTDLMRRHAAPNGDIDAPRHGRLIMELANDPNLTERERFYVYDQILDEYHRGRVDGINQPNPSARTDFRFVNEGLSVNNAIRGGGGAPAGPDIRHILISPGNDGAHGALVYPEGRPGVSYGWARGEQGLVIHEALVGGLHLLRNDRQDRTGSIQQSIVQLHALRQMVASGRFRDYAQGWQLFVRR